MGCLHTFQLEALRAQYEIALAEKIEEEEKESKAKILLATNSNASHSDKIKGEKYSHEKSRTKEDEDAGRTLLVFFRELQTNHKKAVTEDSRSSYLHRSAQQDSVVTDSRSASTMTSNGGTSQSSSMYIKKRPRGKDYILNHNFNLSVQKRNKDYEALSSKNESLTISNNTGSYNNTGSSTGDSESSSSDHGKDTEAQMNSSGDDAEKDSDHVRLMPPRKRKEWNVCEKS